MDLSFEERFGNVAASPPFAALARRAREAALRSAGHCGVCVLVR